MSLAFRACHGWRYHGGTAHCRAVVGRSLGTSVQRFKDEPPSTGKPDQTPAEGSTAASKANVKDPEDSLKKPDKFLDNFHPSKFNREEAVAQAKLLYQSLSQQANQLYHDKFGKKGLELHGEEWYRAKVSFWMKRYEDFVGLTEVKVAQVRVVTTEKAFVVSQDDRRETQRLINEVQQKIKSLHTELERTYRGDDKYLDLVTQEHQVLKEEKALVEQLANRERIEREAFSKLSRAVRDSHESERSQAEKTKYWSVLGSVIGTCLGILGTTINNRLRMRELRQLVKDASAVGSQANAAAAAAAAAALTTAVADASPSPPPPPPPQPPVLPDHTEKLEELSEQIKKVGESTVAKVDEMLIVSLADLQRGLSNLAVVQQKSDTIKKESDETSKRFQDIDGSAVADQIRRLIESYQVRLQTQMEDFKKSLGLDSREVREIQSQIKLIAMKEGDVKKETQRAYDTLNRNASTALESFEKRVIDIEEKLKDVRSLLLSQALAAQVPHAPPPPPPPPVTSSKPAATPAATPPPPPTVVVKTNVKETYEALERSHKTILGSVETSLRDHEQRLNSTILLSSVFVAVLTPVIAFAVSRVI